MTFANLFINDKKNRLVTGDVHALCMMGVYMCCVGNSRSYLKEVYIIQETHFISDSNKTSEK